MQEQRRPRTDAQRFAGAKDVAAGVCSLGLILSLALNYVEVGLDPDGLLWNTARVVSLLVFVGGGILWFLLWRRGGDRAGS